MKRAILFLILIPILFVSCNVQSQAQKKNDADPQAKNVILMIGDGMGVAQIYADITANKDTSNFKRFKYIGFSETYSATNYITESAAGGTAFAIGEKTHNDAVGVDMNNHPKTNIREIAQKHGLSTGVVVTTDLTDATPADFIAHVPNRHMYKKIAKAYLKSGVTVFIGAGDGHFHNPKKGINLVKGLKKEGYQVFYHISDIANVDTGKVAGLLPEKKAPERGDQEEKGVRDAIRILGKNSKGFFLMIEGSKIDDAGHANNLPWLVAEVQDFDKVIGQVLDYAKKNGHTLVIVTADHETGGLTLTGGNIKKGKVKGKFSTDLHTSVMVPVFAYGPGAKEFMGIYQNNAIFDKMMKAYGFEKTN
jgi:alkaline phosphatase